MMTDSLLLIVIMTVYKFLPKMGNSLIHGASLDDLAVFISIIMIFFTWVIVKVIQAALVILVGIVASALGAQKQDGSQPLFLTQIKQHALMSQKE